ncbi:MAG: nucleoside deaminase [Bdellovibrionales bacterium]|nr:nucleoside deaminase [Bdellovibrionales bacterium]
METQPYLLEALRLAIEAGSRGEVPVGAVLVHEGKIVGRGSNSREAMQDPLGHAEMEAIRGASQALGSWRLVDCDLYVTLEPCPMCLAACQQARVRKVVYGAKDEKGGAICLGFGVHDHPKLNHRFEVIYSPMAECSKVLKDFFSTLRNRSS